MPVWAGDREPDLLANVLSLATTLPIAFRRRRSVLGLAIIVVATVLATVTSPSSGIGLAVLIAVYSVAANPDRRQSLVALTLAMIEVAVARPGASDISATEPGQPW